MTTPAINIDETVFADSVLTVKTPDGSFPVPNGKVFVSNEKRHRPASSTNSFANAGRGSWREPMNWSHSGSRSVKGGGTDGYRQEFPAYPGYFTEHTYSAGGFWTVSPVSYSYSENLRRKVEVKVLNKLKNQDIHLGNFVATFRDTLRMFKSHATSIGSSVRKFKHQNPELFKQAARWERRGLPKRDWKCIPSAWLELQYGWIPLLTDVQGAIHHLAAESRVADALFYVRGSSVLDYPTSRVIQSVEGASYGEVIIKGHVSELCAVSLWYRLNGPGLAELSSLGLVDPAEIVWEVLPYSFVVDWFLPVSNWLSALTADLGYSFVSGTLSRKLKYSESAAERLKPSSADVKPIGNLSWTDSGFSFNRSVYGSSPVPGIYVKNPLSEYHIANAMALLATSFR